MMNTEQQDDPLPTDNRPEPPGPAAGRQRRAGLTPPRWVWVVVAVTAALAVVSRWFDIAGQRAVANVVTLVCGFVAFVALALWFLLFSGHRFVYRLVALAVGFAALVGLSSVVRVDHVSGDLVPTFRLRWSAPRDQLLDTLAASAAGASADLATPTPEDYPQFLGKNRDLRYDLVTLERNWDKNPPRLLWRQPIGAGWSAFSAVNGYATTLEQRGEQELVTCYEARTGDLVWSHAIHGPPQHDLGWSRTPQHTDDPRGPSLHAGSDGNAALSRGREWGRCGGARIYCSATVLLPGQDELAVGWGRAASPLIVDNLVVVPAGGPKGGPYVSLAAFDKDTGKLVWEAGDRQVSFSSPVLATLAGRRQIVIVNENNVTGHDPGDGHVLWSCDWPGEVRRVPVSRSRPSWMPTASCCPKVMAAAHSCCNSPPARTTSFVSKSCGTMRACSKRSSPTSFSTAVTFTACPTAFWNASTSTRASAAGDGADTVTGRS